MLRMCSLLFPHFIYSATGGSAIKAVEVLLSHGVPENRIIFINLVGFHLSVSVLICSLYRNHCKISAPEGLQNFCTKFPQLRVITGWIDKGLDDKAYIIPGLGDFGERRYAFSVSGRLLILICSIDIVSN